MKRIFLFTTIIIVGMMVHAQTFNWAQQFSGDGNNAGYCMAKSSSGELYVAGSFEGTVDFDPGEGVYNLTAYGNRDAFIEKMDANGNFIWVKRIGGTNSDYIRNISLGMDDNIYLTGSFSGISDMNPGDDNYFFTSLGGEDMFVVELDVDGNFIWAGHMGGPLDDHATSISISPTGSVYIAGYFLGNADFEPSDTAEYYLQATGQSLFVEKLDNNNQFLWAKMMGGPGFDYCVSLCIDELENLYTTGMFMGPADFDPGEGTAILNSVGDRDIFISKLNIDGEYVWAFDMGGSLLESGQSIVYDNNGNLLLTGNFQGTVDFDPGSGTYNMTSMGDYDIFTGKLDTVGNMIWMKQMGGPGSDAGAGVTFDNDFNVYTTGYFTETADFNPGTGNYEMTSFGDLDIFVSKLDFDGNFVWAADLGGELYDRGLAILTDSQNNIITTGMFADTADFDPSENEYFLYGSGEYDVFISSLSTELLDVSESTNMELMKVFPNPIKQNVNINFGEVLNNVSVCFYDIRGMEILNKQYFQQNKVSIDFDEAPGLYFVKIIAENNQPVTLKVVKH